MPLPEGRIQVYTGDGKGKTTAALGQALRARGRGLRVLFLQFFKLESEPSGEQMLETGIQFRRGPYRHPFFDKKAVRADISAWILGELEKVEKHWQDFDLVVLDEVNNALRDAFISWERFGAFIATKPAQVELVCTGRGAPEALKEKADYVTEFKKLKHPLDRGLAARQGIEY